MAETTAGKASSPQNKLKQGLAALVWRVNRDLQWFQGAQAEVKAAPKRRVACLVIARGLYNESWQSYNIRSARALQKVLKQKYANSPNVQFYLGPWQNNQRKVLIAELNNTALALKEKAYTLLPESLVLSAALADGLYEINDGQHQYFLFKQAQQWQTLLRSPLVNSIEKARLALGCSAEQPATTLTTAQINALLPRGVNKLGLNYWQQGLQQQNRAGTSLPWQKLAITLGSIGALYLVLSSLYLVVQSNTVASQLEEITPKVGALLDQQQQLQQSQQSLQEMSGRFVNDQRINAFWQVFRIAQQTETNSITYLQSNDDTLAMGGQIDEALPLLRQLHDLPEVKSAEFASALRNTRLGQQYRINLVLEEGGQHD